MSLLTFDKVGISGMSAIVPKKIIKNKDYKGPLTKEEIQKAIEHTGIRERRFVDEKTYTSDLFFYAADALLNEMNIDRESIDFLICVTQTPDYRQPPNATLLQHRLGLSKKVGAFDINLACAGYVYGLSTAFAYASLPDVKRILLLVGDISSKIISKNDRATSLLFGDGGSATLIEKKNKNNKSFFSLNSDGGGFSSLNIIGGGYRHPSSAKTLEAIKHKDGSIRSEEHLFMNGMEVFKFTMTEVIKDVRRLIEYSHEKIENIDYLVFHQSNKFMTDHFTKKLKLSISKVPYTIEKFGNTSSASIPLTIVSELKKELHKNNKKLILSGYGGGLSWGSNLLNISDCHIVDLLEV